MGVGALNHHTKAPVMPVTTTRTRTSDSAFFIVLWVQTPTLKKVTDWMGGVCRLLATAAFAATAHHVSGFFFLSTGIARIGETTRGRCAEFIVTRLLEIEGQCI